MKTESIEEETELLPYTDVVASVATATGVTLNSAEFARRQAAQLNTSRTLRNSAGQLMRNTGELAGRVTVRNAARAAGSALAKAGIVTSVASIAYDTTQLIDSKMGGAEYAVRTAGNVLSAIPTPVTAGVGLAVTLGAEYVF
jgi:hypothetical protein